MLKNYLLINTNTKVKFMSTMGSKFDFIWMNSILMLSVVKQRMVSEKFQLPTKFCHTTKPGMNPTLNVNICFIQKTENILNTGTTMIAISSHLWNNLILIIHHTAADIHVYLC